MKGFSTFSEQDSPRITKTPFGDFYIPAILMGIPLPIPSDNAHFIIMFKLAPVKNSRSVILSITKKQRFC